MQWIHQVNIRPNLFETEAVAEATVVNIICRVYNLTQFWKISRKVQLISLLECTWFTLKHLVMFCKGWNVMNTANNLSKFVFLRKKTSEPIKYTIIRGHRDPRMSTHYIIATSLFYYIKKWQLLRSSLLQAMKNCAKHARLVYYCIFHNDQTLKVWRKKITTDNVIQHLLKVITPTGYKKYMVSTNIELLCQFWFFCPPNFQGLILIKNTYNYPRWAFFHGL